ncbi:MAG: hypothetical protein CMC84_01990 [Flavobacteriaceae bacterium]|nr:hypothetical protein [Flavobacteriaceae bacterium]|tara:strand:- start:14369 stop:14938 length:570 start_codon:yes stop_codon:yes gene_type:complete
MTKEDQLTIINDAIKQTKNNLRTLGYNLVFWGIIIISMSLFHYFFPQIIEFSYYSAVFFWVSIPLLGMFYTAQYNIKIGKKTGYETQLDRVIKIIWGVFGLSWIFTVALSYIYKINPVQDILFLLSIVLIMSGLIIKFKKITIGGFGLLIFTAYTYYNPALNLLLVNVIGVSFGMLIPGLALYLQKEHE